MSGLEGIGGEGETSFEWFVSLGNLLSIVISGTVVVGAIVALIRYLKKNVTEEIVSLKESVNKDLSYLADKVTRHESTTEEGLAANIQRMTEVKQMIEIIDRRLTEVKSDVNKRIDQKAEEIAKLVERLDQLKEEYYKLNLEIVRRINVQSSRLDKHEDTEDPPAHQG